MPDSKPTIPSPAPSKLGKITASLRLYWGGFRVLQKETGSIGKAYQTVRHLIQKEGLRAGKNLLKSKYFDKDVLQAHVFTQALFARQQAEFSREDLQAQQQAFAVKPLISVIMPMYGTPEKWLARVVESLQEQIYPHWELCVVDDCSPTDAQRALIRTLAGQDSRIRYHFSEKNGGISAASNLALDMAQGGWVALVDHDDELPPDALFWLAKAINDIPDADFIYTDECKIDDSGKRYLFDLIAKPDWSPEIMLNGMITGHLTAYQTQLVRRVGGFRPAYDFSQDYDLALRCGRLAQRIVHIPRILYLWRSIPGSAASGGKSYARESNLAALRDHLAQLGVSASVSALPHANRVSMQPEKPLSVSIVIPSDSYDNLKEAVNGLLARTDYPDYEIVAVCNSPLADRLRQEYAAEPRLRFSPYDKPYNFSDKCNQGARDAGGELVVFYNDDVIPANTDWLHRLAEYLYLPGVGGVSPELLYSQSNLIQYAGLISGTPGLCGLAYNGYDRYANDGHLSMHRYVRDVSILSGACCIMRKAVFEAVGGFDAENTPDGHSDVVLSYKLAEAGYRCVYTPYSVLYHAGNHSWSHKKGKYKADIYCLKHWGRYLSSDPYFTGVMKEALYRDYTFGYKIHAGHLDPAKNYTGKDILFVSPDLDEGGRNRSLLQAALSVSRNGGFAVVTAPRDGAMRQQLAGQGICVIIDASIGSGHFLFSAFARNFDAVVVDTQALLPVAQELSAIEDLPVFLRLQQSTVPQNPDGSPALPDAVLLYESAADIPQPLPDTVRAAAPDNDTPEGFYPMLERSISG